MPGPNPLCQVNAIPDGDSIGLMTEVDGLRTQLILMPHAWGAVHHQKRSLRSRPLPGQTFNGGGARSPK